MFRYHVGKSSEPTTKPQRVTGNDYDQGGSALFSHSLNGLDMEKFPLTERRRRIEKHPRVRIRSGPQGASDPVPFFNMTVKGSRIAYIQFSGPREGEYLAADEVRFTPIDADRK